MNNLILPRFFGVQKVILNSQGIQYDMQDYHFKTSYDNLITLQSITGGYGFALWEG